MSLSTRAFSIKSKSTRFPGWNGLAQASPGFRRTWARRMSRVPLTSRDRKLVRSGSEEKRERRTEASRTCGPGHRKGFCFKGFCFKRFLFQGGFERKMRQRGCREGDSPGEQRAPHRGQPLCSQIFLISMQNKGGEEVVRSGSEAGPAVKRAKARPAEHCFETLIDGDRCPQEMRRCTVNSTGTPVAKNCIGDGRNACIHGRGLKR